MDDYFAHESCYIDQPCIIGRGTKIWHFSHIMSSCSIGENCNIGQNTVISQGVVLGNNCKVQNNVSVYTGVICEDNVFLGPSCVFTNVINPRAHVNRKNEYKKTLIKEGASIGANATIICGCIIGKYAFVGAGSVVTRDVPDYALVMGNPARIRGWMCKCGQKLSFECDSSCDLGQKHDCGCGSSYSSCHMHDSISCRCKGCGTVYEKVNDFVQVRI